MKLQSEGECGVCKYQSYYDSFSKQNVNKLDPFFTMQQNISKYMPNLVVVLHILIQNLLWTTYSHKYFIGEFSFFRTNNILW